MNYKKAELGFLMIMIVAIVSGFIMIGVSVKLFSSVDTELQDTICRANIIAGKQAIDKNSNSMIGVVWNSVKKEVVTNSLENPLCTTKTRTIDLQKTKSKEEALALFSVELGEMVEGCWKTFGEGRIPNTFGQEKTFRDTIFFRSEDEKYFTCYKFNVLFPNIDDKISVQDLTGEKGTLWRLNLEGNSLYNKDGFFEPKGIKIDTSNYKEFIEAPFIENEFLKNINSYYEEKTTKNTPYAGFVMWDGFGFLEFPESLEYDLSYDPSTNQLGKGIGVQSVTLGAAIGTAWAGAGVISAVCWPCAPFAGIIAGTVSVGLAGASLYTGVANLYQTFENHLVPGTNQMEFIEANEWYDIRYYSPYIGENYQVMILNSIKVMRTGAEGGKEVIPVEIK